MFIRGRCLLGVVLRRRLLHPSANADLPSDDVELHAVLRLS